MFNEFTFIKDPDNCISGFCLMSADDLFKFSEANGLSFTKDQIIYIQGYFKNVRKSVPTYNQLMFFDTLNKIRQSQKKGYSIYSASATSDAGAILDSSQDLISKRDAIGRKVLGSMPMPFAAEIASEYLNDVGYGVRSTYFIPALQAKKLEYYIHTSNKTPLFAYSDPDLKKESAADKESGHTVFAVLYPDDNIDYTEYQSRVNELLTLPQLDSLILTSSTVEAPYGLFDTFKKQTDGITVTLANIPEVEKNEDGKVLYLSSLLTACTGKLLFSTKSNMLPVINKAAEIYSLRAYIVAIKNDSKALSLESRRNPAFSFDFDFLKNIMHFYEPSNYKFTSEKDLPLGTRKNVYITFNNNSSNQTYHAEKTLNFGKILASAAARNLNGTPHKTAATAIIDAINPLIAKGISKNSIALTIHYDLLCGTDDSAELGKNLAAILGAYRSMIELCVADTAPQISYNTKERSIVAVASAKSPKKQIKSSFASGNTHLYFYPIKFTEDIPDYENYRSFIKYFYSLIEKDNILSAFSVNENFSLLLDKASKDTCVNFDVSFNVEDMENAHGILFETKKIIAPNDAIYYVGATAEKI